jgi:hypothetical protein
MHEAFLFLYLKMGNKASRGHKFGVRPLVKLDSKKQQRKDHEKAKPSNNPIDPNNPPSNPIEPITTPSVEFTPGANGFWLIVGGSLAALVGLYVITKRT